MPRDFLCAIGLHKWTKWIIEYPRRKGPTVRTRDCTHCLITQRTTKIIIR